MTKSFSFVCLSRNEFLEHFLDNFIKRLSCKRWPLQTCWLQFSQCNSKFCQCAKFYYHKMGGEIVLNNQNFQIVCVWPPYGCVIWCNLLNWTRFSSIKAWLNLCKVNIWNIVWPARCLDKETLTYPDTCKINKSWCNRNVFGKLSGCLNQTKMYDVFGWIYLDSDGDSD